MREGLREKLAIFAGFSKMVHINYHCLGHWHYGGDFSFVEPPDFGNDLNVCFEWLEPPLRERLGIFHIAMCTTEGVGFTCFMNRKAVEWPYRYEGHSKDLTVIGIGVSRSEAFCDAAGKAIEKFPELEGFDDKQGRACEKSTDRR